jgi:hypothetical protein
MNVAAQIDTTPRSVGQFSTSGSGSTLVAIRALIVAIRGWNSAIRVTLFGRSLRRAPREPLDGQRAARHGD